MCITVVGIERVPAIMPATREPNWPLALSSTATSRRSSFDTKPLASISSRSSRSFSSLRIGSRASAQRKVGGIASVVSDRHGDDHREQVLAERAHRQADGRDDHLGRAARVHAGRQRQRLAPRQPAELAAEEGAAEFADGGDGDQAERQQQKVQGP